METHLSAEEYLKTRVDDQIDWYDRKSGALKKRYQRMKIVTIVLGVLIPVAIALNTALGEWANYAAAFFGAAISALEGISGMLKDKDTHLAYRSTREALMREKMLFTTNAGPYSDKSTAFALFVANCETYMATENTKWLQLFSKEDKKDQPAGK